MQAALSVSPLLLFAGALAGQAESSSATVLVVDSCKRDVYRFSLTPDKRIGWPVSICLLFCQGSTCNLCETLNRLFMQWCCRHEVYLQCSGRSSDEYGYIAPMTHDADADAWDVCWRFEPVARRFASNPPRWLVMP